jgi:mannose-6-phosphate isomerase-like protein (cupin superfamily)
MQRRNLAGFAAAAALVVAGFMTLAQAAPDKPVYLFWTAAQLNTLEKKMYTTMDATKGSHEDLMPAMHSYFMMFHREATAPKAEVHEKHGDFGYVRTGEGIIVTGGKFTGGTRSGPNEMRGTIEGGTEHRLKAGDAFYIPANMPHQIVVEPGHRFNAEMLKVERKDGAADIAAFMSWNSGQLVDVEKKLKTKMDKYYNAVDNFIINDSYTAMMNHKEGTAESEIHVHLAEFQIILTGEGAMDLGGKVVNSRTAGPNEIRGTALEGAARQPLMPGDMLYIPPNTPHHTIVSV